MSKSRTYPVRQFKLAVSLTMATAFVMLACASATANLLMVPNVATNLGGVGYPFDLSDPGIGGPQSTMRYQQVYAASQFAAFGGARAITQIAFREDGMGHSFSTTISNVQIDLSTTTATPDNLNSTFAANVGADDKIVHTGAFSLASAGPPDPYTGPGAFDIIVNLSQPFTYDPAAGNLLMDVRVFSPATTSLFDAANVQGDSVSCISTLASGVSSPTSEFSTTQALVTQFQFVPVPEPSAFALAAFGFMAVTAWRLRTLLAAKWL
jgi:hypothetical protein